jgi:hypothetical protein
MPLIHSEQLTLVLGGASFWHWEKSITCALNGAGASVLVGAGSVVLVAAILAGEVGSSVAAIGIGSGVITSAGGSDVPSVAAGTAVDRGGSLSATGSIGSVAPVVASGAGGRAVGRPTAPPCAWTAGLLMPCAIARRASVKLALPPLDTITSITSKMVILLSCFFKFVCS